MQAIPQMNDSAHAQKNFDPEANGKHEPETVSKVTVHAVGQGIGFACSFAGCIHPAFA